MFNNIKKNFQEKMDIFLTFILITFLSLAYHYRFMEPYENLILDKLRNSFKNSEKVSQDVVYLLTDQSSLSQAEIYYKMGWPWKRSTYSKMIDFITNINGVIAFDALFTEKSIYTYLNIPDDKLLQESLNNDKVIMANFFSISEKNFYQKVKDQTIEIKNKYEKILKNELKDKYSETDLLKKLEEIINKSVKKSDIIKIENLNQAYTHIEEIIKQKQFDKMNTYSKVLDRFKVKIKSENKDNIIGKYHDVQIPLKDYLVTLKHLGNVYGNIDIDGITRRNPILIEFNGQYFPSLSFISYLLHKKIDEIEVHKDSLKVGDLVIPLTNDGQFLIKYYAVSSNYLQVSQINMLLAYDFIEFLYNKYLKNYQKFPIHEKLSKEAIYQNKENFLQVRKYLSDLDPKILEPYVIHEKNLSIVPPWELKNKIFIVADAIPGHHDIRPTPLNSEELGAHIHGTIINNLINGDVSQEIRQSTVIYFILIFLPFFILFTIRNINVIYSLFAITSIITIILGIFFYFFISLNINMDILTILISIIMVFFIVSIINYFKESKQKKYIQQAFSQYLSPKVIQTIIKDPSKLNLGGINKEISVFFSDIQGFSTISEQLTAKEIVQILNIYLTEMCNIIIEYDGVIDKFIGDAILAFWGAPLEQKDHAIRACYTSIDMQKKLALIQDEFKSYHFGSLLMRIGVNSGNAVVGNMGSIQRTDYTMIGDVVNTASRLEGANKAYGTYTMIANNTYNFVKDLVDVRELDTILVVGKKLPVTVYELLDRKNQTPDPIASAIDNYYNKGLALYKDKNFKDALEYFDKFLNVLPQDKVGILYKERTLNYIQNPPNKQDDQWLWTQLKSK